MNHTIYPDRKLNLCHNMKHQILSITLALAALAISRSALAQREIDIGGVPGYQDTPMEPGGKWHVHDPGVRSRPSSRPARSARRSSRETAGRRHRVVRRQRPFPVAGQGGRAAPWKLTNGEMISSGSDIVSTREFGDMQLHVEFCEPTPPAAAGRGAATAAFS